MERGNLLGFGEDPASWKQSSSIGGNIGRFSPLTYLNWQNTQWFVDGPSGLGQLADFDGDGVVNAMEYFMGLNPRVADGTVGVTSTTVIEGGLEYLTISFRVSLALPTSGSTAVTYGVEGSSDLTLWDNQTTQVGTAVNNGDGTVTQTYRDNVPLTGSTKRFLRVKATVP